MKQHLTAIIVATLVLSGCSDSTESTTSEPKAATAEKSQGQLAYESHCIVCHSNALNGAPIPGKPLMWEPRVAQGVDVLIEHAINGYGLMPAKGGKTEMPDEDVAAAVRYMISQ